MRTDGCDSVEDQVDERCDAFEQACRSGHRPRITDFLESDDRIVRVRLFRELLLVELEYRRLHGEQPAQKDYLRDFPEFASQIEAIDLQYGQKGFATAPAH